MKLSIVGIILFFTVHAFAESPAAGSAAPAAVAAPAASAPAGAIAQPSPSQIDAAQKVVDKIPTSIPAWILAVIAFMVEMCMRFWPTVKPRSIFIFIGTMVGIVGAGFIKISGLLDLIVQNIKEPSAPQ